MFNFEKLDVWHTHAKIYGSALEVVRMLSGLRDSLKD
jgi:hypothetical protein